jgi:hypothetical protein
MQLPNNVQADQFHLKPAKEISAFSMASSRLDKRVRTLRKRQPAEFRPVHRACVYIRDRLEGYWSRQEYHPIDTDVATWSCQDWVHEALHDEEYIDVSNYDDVRKKPLENYN